MLFMILTSRSRQYRRWIAWPYRNKTMCNEIVSYGLSRAPALRVLTKAGGPWAQKLWGAMPPRPPMKDQMIRMTKESTASRRPRHAAAPHKTDVVSVLVLLIIKGHDTPAAEGYSPRKVL